MSLVRVLLLSVALTACASAPEPPPPAPAVERELPPVVVTDEMIATIEANIVMPAGARPLADYDRYYGGARLGERAGVMITYLSRRSFADIDRTGMTPVEGRPNVYSGDIDSVPRVADGGCAVVTAYFDIETQRFVSMYLRHLNIDRAPAVCNGEA